MSQTDNKDELARLRGNIDTIDDEIMALLKKRSEIVEKVGALKVKNGQIACYIRSGREATMLRRIYNQFQGSKFSAQAAAAIWRLIIAASTSVEGELKISVFTQTQDISLAWLAREYFGNFTTLIRQPAATRVIGDVLDGKASVGILPMPSNEDATPWWPHLIQKGQDMPNIFAVIPFVQDSKDTRAPLALAVARITPEPTGDDTTLLTIQTDENTSTNRIATALSKIGLEASWLSAHSPAPAIRQHLISAKGFYVNGHEALEKLSKELPGAAITPLGSYANPILTNKANHDDSKKSANS